MTTTQDRRRVWSWLAFASLLILIGGCDEPAGPAPATSPAAAARAEPASERRSAEAAAGMPTATKAGGGTSEAAPTAGSAPTGQSATGAYEVIENPELKGRLGRMIIAFPETGGAVSTRVDIFKPGETNAAQGFYGGKTLELLPGRYDVSIAKKRLAGVPVEPRSDTRLRLGVLHVRADGQTRIDIVDADETTTLHSGYGEQTVGLPPGEYFIQISGQRERVKVEDGKMTEF